MLLNVLFTIKRNDDDDGLERIANYMICCPHKKRKIPAAVVCVDINKN
jgi:hypothetical protein